MMAAGRKPARIRPKRRLYQKVPIGVHLLRMETNAKSESPCDLHSIKWILAIALVALAALVSCSSRIGWGVVLWSVKGTSAKAGSIVPIYLKSNITKVYVIGLEDEKDVKLEVPLWQVEMFSSRRAAEQRIQKMGDYVSTYMIALRDGLPVRDKPSNAAKRVYRLHEKELVKILEKVEGEAVFTGNTQLPGDWYQVLTLDGTRGYVFSNTMQMFDETAGEAPALQSVQTDQDTINAVFSKTWRPAWYATMLGDNTVDLDYFSLRYGLFGDAINRQVRIELPGVSKVFQYSTITQDKDWLVFGSTDLRIKQESPETLIASWGPADDVTTDTAADWQPGATFIRCIVVSQDIREAIRVEEARRQAALRSFFSAALSMKGNSGNGTAGVLRIASSQAGALELWPSGLYTWSDTQNLPAGFAPSGTEGDGAQNGTIVFGLRLSEDLSRAWQGGFSLYPDTTGQRSDYVYNVDAKGLVIAKAVTAGLGGMANAADKRLGTADFEFGAKQ